MVGAPPLEGGGRARMSDLAACTIVARNYLAQARVLSRTFLAQHPGARMLVLVMDDGPIDLGPEPFTPVRLEDLGLPDRASLCFKYTLLELCTAVKPFFLEHVFERYGVQRLLYLDPDVWVLDRLDPLWEVLTTHAIALVPHITDPIDDELLPNEQTFLRCGAYNLGFLGLRDAPAARRMLTWWQRRCYEQCVVRLEQGLFVDQKWIDLVPAIFEEVAIVRDPGYNVAYWNLHARQLRPNGSGWYVNGERLRFFHFSGYDPDVPAAVSKHQTRFDVDRLGAGGRLFDEYRTLLLRDGYREAVRSPLPFSTFDDGVPVSPIVRHLYLSLGPERQAFGNPFVTGHPGSFRAWLMAPAPGEPPDPPCVSNLLAHVPVVRTDLRDRFPDYRGRHREEYLEWLRASGPWQLGLDASFLVCTSAPPAPRAPVAAVRPASAPPVGAGACRLCTWLPLLDRHGYGTRVRALGQRALRRPAPLLAPPPPPAPAPAPVKSSAAGRPAAERRAWPRRLIARLVQAGLRPCTRHHLLTNLIAAGVPAPPGLTAPPRRPVPARANLPPGVNLAGYLTTESGVGEAARLVVRALAADGLSHAMVNVEPTYQLRRTDRTLDGFSDGNPYGVNLVHVNADQVPVFAATQGADFFAGHYNIGFWMWELAEFPVEWADRFGWFDEIWTPSAYTSEAIARQSPVPVWTSPLPLVPHPAAALGRNHFGLPDNRFVFLFVFDFASVFERKNPLALLAAFRRAFRRDDRVLLVLKTSNEAADPRNAGRLRAACAGLPVRRLETALARPEVAALMQAADAYVSLHRAEGYGLTMAEAMGLGKPVIATGYSGNLEFMNDGNSLLVPYRLVEVNGDAGPYPSGQLWAAPDVDRAAELMRWVFEERAAAAAVAERGRVDIATRRSPAAVGAAIRTRLEARRAWATGRAARDPVPRRR